MPFTSERARHLNEISRVLAEIGTDFSAVLAKVAREVAERIGDAALLELIAADGEFLIPTSVHHCDPVARSLARSLAEGTRSRVGEGVTGVVAATGTPLLMPTIDNEALRALLTPDVRGYLDRYPVYSAVVVPLRTHEGPVGVLTVWRDRGRPGERPFGPGDVEFLQAVADHAALAIVNARLYDRLQQTHRALTARTRALEQALDELETFAWSVSHDLRAPLHSIQGFARALVDDYGDVLDDMGRGFLERIEGGAERMNELIEALLDLSRLSRLELACEWIDISAMCETLVAEQRERQPEREVEVRVQPHIVAEGDPRMMRAALGNLLSNAWKFTAHRLPAHVEIEGDVRPEGTRIIVRDDGIGFDMAHAARLFAPFQRLHARVDYPGTGIGLATVARVVRKHGGRISGYGQIGHGAEFQIYLPSRATIEGG